MSLEEFRYDIEMCLRCSSCKWIDPMWARSKRYNKICPINAHFRYDAYSSQGMMDIALAILEGEMDYTPTLAHIAYHCTLCGACDVMCKRILETERLQVIERIREELTLRGLGPDEERMNLARTIEETRNSLGAPWQKRVSWLEGSREGSLRPGASTVFFVGCASSYLHPEIARATVDLLAAGGVEFTVLGNREWCCGNPLFRSGMLDEGRKVMEHNLETVKNLGATTVVTSCAECYHAWKVDYPRQYDRTSLGLEVLHVTEVVAGLLATGNLEFTAPVEARVTYHDSCRLARLSEPNQPWSGIRLRYGITDPPKQIRRGSKGVYFQPRKILAAIPGLELVEMERVRENAFCCGAGGSVRRFAKDFALTTGAERLSEAVDSGAELLATACPFCKTNLSEAARTRGLRIDIRDIVEIAAEAL